MDREERRRSRTLDAIFWQTCEWEFEYLEGWATGSGPLGEDALFPDDNVTLEQDGRSRRVDRSRGRFLPDIDEWDAVRLARWRRFERIARGIADDIPYLCLSSRSTRTNGKQASKRPQRSRGCAARQDIATVPCTLSPAAGPTIACAAAITMAAALSRLGKEGEVMRIYEIDCQPPNERRRIIRLEARSIEEATASQRATRTRLWMHQVIEPAAAPLHH